MLQLTITAQEFFNEETQEFIQIKPVTIQMEHSLVSISKWEAKWHKPFLTEDNKTDEELIDYLRCMTITQNVNPYAYYAVSNEQLKQVRAYISNPMTATTFREDKNKPKGKKQIITSEVIYYQMIALNIPMECQKWHLNRLMTLIRVVAIKNQPEKKMKSGDQIRQYADLNNMRRAAMRSKG